MVSDYRTSVAAVSGEEVGHLKSSYLDFVISEEKSASPKKNVGLNSKEPVQLIHLADCCSSENIFALSIQRHKNVT